MHIACETLSITKNGGHYIVPEPLSITKNGGYYIVPEPCFFQPWTRDRVRRHPVNMQDEEAHEDVKMDRCCLAGDEDHPNNLYCNGPDFLSSVMAWYSLQPPRMGTGENSHALKWLTPWGRRYVHLPTCLRVWLAGCLPACLFLSGILCFLLCSVAYLTDVIRSRDYGPAVAVEFHESLYFNENPLWSPSPYLWKAQDRPHILFAVRTPTAGDDECQSCRIALLSFAPLPWD